MPIFFSHSRPITPILSLPVHRDNEKVFGEKDRSICEIV
jgi:hypothetical protein